MNNTIKWMTFGFLIAGLPILRAQTILSLPTSGTNGSGSTLVNFYFRTDGTLMEKGSGTASLSSADLESGSRLIWYPTQSAFRAGYGSSSETVSQIGQYSTAFGYQSIASGEYSTAFGWSQATGSFSFAGGYGNATAYNTVALGGAAFATSFNAIALGSISTASGGNSISIGNSVTANASNSIAIGSGSSATGAFSIAIGSASAGGTNSAVIGTSNAARSYGELAVGQNCSGVPESGTVSATTWQSTDPLFEIGNGNPSPSDALVVYKDGSAKFAGPITVPQSGDIPMYNGD